MHIFSLAKTEACERCRRLGQFSSYTVKMRRNAFLEMHFFLKLGKLIIPNSVLFGGTELTFIALTTVGLRQWKGDFANGDFLQNGCRKTLVVRKLL